MTDLHPASFFTLPILQQKQASNATNTMQVILSTSGQDSFALFLFPDDGINWLRGEGKVKNLPDARAQSGFSASDGRFLTLPGSGTDQLFNYDKYVSIAV
jgi:nidogen (entactin)